MKRILNPREKRLLIGCLSTIFLVANVLLFREFSARHKTLATSIQQLQDQNTENKQWLKDRTFWEKRGKWLDANMAYTDSAGRSQGQLLEELQNSALDADLKISNQTLLEPTQLSADPALNYYNEVAVSLRVRGDQDKVLHWLLSLQSPERFEAMKTFEIELDAKAKEKIPQAQCNLTLARWFNPVAPPTLEPSLDPALDSAPGKSS